MLFSCWLRSLRREPTVRADTGWRIRLASDQPSHGTIASHAGGIARSAGFGRAVGICAGSGCGEGVQRARKPSLALHNTFACPPNAVGSVARSSDEPDKLTIPLPPVRWAAPRSKATPAVVSCRISAIVARCAAVCSSAVVTEGLQVAERAGAGIESLGRCVGRWSIGRV